MSTLRANAVRTRDVVLALAIVVGFIIFQVGTNWRAIGEGPELILAILGLLVVLGAVATLIYDHRATGERLDIEPEAVVQEPGWAHFLFHDTRSAPLWLASSTITTSNMSSPGMTVSARRWIGMIQAGMAERQRSSVWRATLRKRVAFLPVPAPMLRIACIQALR